MRYTDLYSSTLNQLKDPSSALDVQIIMEKSFRLTRSEFWIRKNDPITNRSGLQKFYRLRKRLAQKEPLAYILKEKEFYSFPFHVNSNVLIPRPETELLIEKTLTLVNQPGTILDIGAGSGNISVTLARETSSFITATEIDPGAISVLKKNIFKGDVGDRVKIIRTDLFPPKGSTFDIIVSNPPYLTSSEWEKLPFHIKKYEPRHALESGPTGLEILSRIIRAAPAYLKRNGHLVLEIGYNQKAGVIQSLKQNGFSKIQVTDDLNKIPRVVCARC